MQAVTGGGGVRRRGRNIAQFLKFVPFFYLSVGGGTNTEILPFRLFLLIFVVLIPKIIVIFARNQYLAANKGGPILPIVLKIPQIPLKRTHRTTTRV